MDRNNTYPDTPEGRAASAREDRERDFQTGIQRATIDHMGSGWFHSRYDAQMAETRIKANVNPLFLLNRDQFNKEYEFLKEQKAFLNTEIHSLIVQGMHAANKANAIYRERSAYTAKSAPYIQRHKNLYDVELKYEVIRDKLYTNLSVYNDVIDADARAAARAAAAPSANPLVDSSSAGTAAGGAGGPPAASVVRNFDLGTRKGSRKGSRKGTRKGSRKGSRKQRRA